MAENIVMSEMTWTEVDEALKERPVALLPVGAVEAHGPHLPVSADTVIASTR
jgi:creatinine amidohydrolase/Fe(II)-dependent formamide hydrolase-like protein